MLRFPPPLSFRARLCACSRSARTYLYGSGTRMVQLPRKRNLLRLLEATVHAMHSSSSSIWCNNSSRSATPLLSLRCAILHFLRNGTQGSPPGRSVQLEEVYSLNNDPHVPGNPVYVAWQPCVTRPLEGPGRPWKKCTAGTMMCLATLCVITPLYSWVQLVHCVL